MPFAKADLLVDTKNKLVYDFVLQTKPRHISLGHEQYFQRNIIESINFSLKSRFRSLRNKLHYMKKREFAWKIITYNLEKLSQITKALFYLLTRAGILFMVEQIELF